MEPIFFFFFLAVMILIIYFAIAEVIKYKQVQKDLKDLEERMKLQREEAEAKLKFYQAKREAEVNRKEKADTLQESMRKQLTVPTVAPKPIPVGPKPVEPVRTVSKDYQYTDQLARERRVRDEYYSTPANPVNDIVNVAGTAALAYAAGVAVEKVLERYSYDVSPAPAPSCYDYSSDSLSTSSRYSSDSSSSYSSCYSSSSDSSYSSSDCGSSSSCSD